MSKFNVGDKVRQNENGIYWDSDRVGDKIGIVESIDDEPALYPVEVRYVGSDPVDQARVTGYDLWRFKENELDLVLDA